MSENLIIGGKTNAPTEIVYKIEKEQRVELTPEYFFNLFKTNCEQEIEKGKLKKSRLNSKGRKYFLFPLLERNNIDSWEKLNFEMNLIDEKKSELSSNLRNAVNHLHTHIMLNYLKSKENEK